MKPKITPSTGNIFRDLGFRREEAEHLLVRTDALIDMLARLDATVRLTGKVRRAA